MFKFGLSRANNLVLPDELESFLYLIQTDSPQHTAFRHNTQAV